MTERLRKPGRRGVRRYGLILAAAALLSLGGVLLGKAAYIDAKAVLAQHLLRDAWAKSLETGAPVRPWPWADTQTVARLRLAGGSVDQIVLAGASGRNLAFGPTQVQTPAALNLTILSGHRDTHFAFLRDLSPGRVVEMQGLDGKWRRFRVSGGEVLHAQRAVIPARAAGAPEGLVLVTCWPFDAVDPGTPWRYVISALPEPDDLLAGVTDG